MLFGGLDTGGVLSTDKPPLALWVMTASVRTFGLSPASLIWPQLLMTLATVVVLHRTVRLCWGPAAALVAAAVMASTPVVTVLARYNHPDTLLVLLVTVAAHLSLRAARSDDARWPLALGAVVGAAFLTKWLVVVLVLPGLAAGYLTSRRRPAGTGPPSRPAGRRLALVGSAAVVVAGWWPVLVWVTPSSTRPWLDGTTSDSVWDLVLGRNGFSRIGTETAGTLMGTGPGVPWNPVSGAPGPARLLMAPFAAQTGWFLALAVGATVLGATSWVRHRLRPRSNGGGPADPGLALFGGWLLVTGAVFSLMSGPIHPYYTALTAPAAAALIGRLVVELVASRAVLVVTAAVAATALWVATATARTGHEPVWMTATSVGVLIVGSVTLWVTGSNGRAPDAASSVVRGGRTLLAALVLLTPAALGSLATVTHAVTGPDPLAGPGAGEAPHMSSRLTTFLRSHHDYQRWGAAMAPASSASRLALDTELAVLPIGGFVGNIPTPTLTRFRDMVRHNEIRYLVLTDPFTGSQDPHTPPELKGSVAAAIVAWAESVGRPIHLEGETTAVLDLAPALAPAQVPTEFPTEVPTRRPAPAADLRWTGGTIRREVGG